MINVGVGSDSRATSFQLRTEGDCYLAARNGFALDRAGGSFSRLGCRSSATRLDRMEGSAAELIVGNKCTGVAAESNEAPVIHSLFHTSLFRPALSTLILGIIQAVVLTSAGNGQSQSCKGLAIWPCFPEPTGRHGMKAVPSSLIRAPRTAAESGIEFVNPVRSRVRPGREHRSIEE